MIARDQLADLRIGIFAIRLALRLHRLVVGGHADGARDKRPIVAARVVKPHAHALLAHRGGEFAHDIPGGMLPVFG